MLTSKQRAYLTGEAEIEGEYARQKRYSRRKNIKERFKHTILDFQLLFKHWDDKGEGSLLERREFAKPNELGIDEGVADMMALLLYEMDVTDGYIPGATKVEAPGGVAHQPLGEPAASIIDGAIRRAHLRDGNLVENVELNIELSDQDKEEAVTEIVEKLNQEERLTTHDWNRLQSIDDLDKEILHLLEDYISDD